MNAVATLAPQVGVVNACEVLGVARASYYRYQARDDNPPLAAMRSRSPLALSKAERQQVLESYCTQSALSTRHHPRSTPPCLTKASTGARCARCTVS